MKQGSQKNENSNFDGFTFFTLTYTKIINIKKYILVISLLVLQKIYFSDIFVKIRFVFETAIEKEIAVSLFSGKVYIIFFRMIERTIFILNMFYLREK